MARYFIYLLTIILLIIALSVPPSAYCADECVVLKAPLPGSVVIGKQPEVKAEFQCPIKSDTLVVIFDAVDVTQILDKTEKGFSYTPETLTSAGSHTLKISYMTPDGTPKQQELTFITRHSEIFGEVYSKNDATLVYSGTVLQTGSATDAAVPFNTTPQGTQSATAPSTTAAIPRSKFEANLNSESKIKEENKGVTFAASVRYLDQDIPVADPLKKGFTVANWQLNGDYQKETLKAKFSVGDIILNETPYTVSSLSRKGTMISGEMGPVFLNAFSGRMEQSFGVDGGVGIGNPDRDHIMGASGGVKLFNNQVEARVIYVSGTDPSNYVLPVVAPATPPQIQPNTFGTTTTSGQKSGDATSILLKTDFFTGKLRTEMEATTVNFDPDISDEFGKKSAVAYRAKAGGSINWYAYEIGYEYLGKNFGVVGNSALQKDRKGFTFMSGVNLADQNLIVTGSRYTDNVEDDPLFAQNVSTTGTVSYQFRKIPNVPLGLTYTKAISENKNVPAGQVPVDLHTDTYAGQIGLTVGRLNVSFTPSYSFIDDKTVADADTTSITYALTAGYVYPAFSILPAVSWSRSRNHQTDVWSDIYTGSLDLRTKFFSQRVSFDVGGSYALSKADNESVHNETWNGRAALSYNLSDHLKKMRFKPTAGIRFNYLKIADKVNITSDKDEFSLLVVLEASMPVIF